MKMAAALRKGIALEVANFKLEENLFKTTYLKQLLKQLI